MSNTEMQREFGWDDTITKDASDFVVLPEGDYDFTVESFDRGRHNGSDKLPACNKAILKIRVEAPEGEVVLTHNLFLHSITEGMLSAFFTSIGQKKKGEPLKMNWSMVPGSKGRLKLGIRHYQKDGEDRTINEIKRFYPKEAPKYTPGSF
jgi:hypothetical protein